MMDWNTTSNEINLEDRHFKKKGRYMIVVIFEISNTIWNPYSAIIVIPCPQLWTRVNDNCIIVALENLTAHAANFMQIITFNVSIVLFNFSAECISSFIDTYLNTIYKVHSKWYSTLDNNELLICMDFRCNFI